MLEIVNLFNFKEVLFSFNGNAYINTVYISTSAYDIKFSFQLQMYFSHLFLR